MSNNLSQRRAAEGSYEAKRASNTFGRSRSRQDNSRKRSDAAQQFRRQTPSVTSNYASRGLGNSGVYQRALQQFTGDYSDQVQRFDEADLDAERSYEMNNQLYEAEYDQTLADLENKKAMQIAETAAGINSLRPLIG